MRRNSMRMSSALVVLLALGAPAAVLAIDPHEFSSPAEEARFKSLVEELRCLMCQNQSLGDSEAFVARDLRKEVLEQLRSGKSDDEVKQFLVERYGDFVLYRPPVKPKTWLLWFGPAVVLVLGGIVLARVVRGRARALTPEARGEEDLP